MFENFEKDIEKYGQMTIIQLKYKLQRNFKTSNSKNKYVILEKNIVSYLNNLKVIDLKEIAKQYNISTNGSTTKSDLIELLKKPVTDSAILGFVPKSSVKSNEISKIDEASLIKKVEDLIDNVKKENDMPVDNKFTESILHSQKYLKQYLSNLIYIEKEIQFLKEHLIKLEIYRETNEEKLKQHNKYLIYNLNGEVELLQYKIKKSKDYIVIKRDENAIEIDEPIPPDFSKPTPPVSPKLTTIMKPVIPTEPVYETPSFFNKKKVATHNAELKRRYDELLNLYKEKLYQYEVNLNQNNILQKKYEDDMAIYQKDLAEYEIIQSDYQNSLKEYKEAYKKFYDKLFCEKQKEFIKSCKNELLIKKSVIENVKKQISKSQSKLFLTKEINLAKKELEETVKVRNKLYAYNIIYEKYRNLVALSTIYEYIDSGRCETLEGPTGAYNLFESELRFNLIISDLTLINNSLEQIKENQFLLYKELNDVNKNLKEIDISIHDAVNELSSKLEDSEVTLSEISENADKIQKNTTTMASDVNKIANNTALTAYNSIITAYYSKLTAKRVAVLGFLTALK